LKIAFHYVHMARKVVGVGSVGTRAWILLMLGRDDQDPLFLQAKEAQESVLSSHLPREVVKPDPAVSLWMLIVTLSRRESEPSAVTWTGVRSRSAWGVLDLEALEFEGVRRTELSAV
jgi:hypothetical protein